MIMNDLQTFILEFQKRKASSFLASLSQAKQSKQNNKEDNSTQSTSKSDASEEPVTIHPVRHSCGKYWETIWAGILVVSTEKQYEQAFLYTKYFQNDGIKNKHKLSISKILCILCIWLELSKLCNIWKPFCKGLVQLYFGYSYEEHTDTFIANLPDFKFVPLKRSFLKHIYIKITMV